MAKLALLVDATGALLRRRKASRRWSARDGDATAADLSAFEAIHAAVQRAWSADDLVALRRLTTPAMLSHLVEELARDSRRGVRNIVSRAELVTGSLAETWKEGEAGCGAVVMRWRAIDYWVALEPRSDGSALVVSGDPRRPIEVEEVWVFRRERGGEWLLSAIEQV